MGGLLLVQDFLRQSASQSLLHQRTVSQNNTAVTTVAPPQVSIASSSANSFTGIPRLSRRPKPTLSQSLLHQRTVSQSFRKSPGGTIMKKVSIASSSANSFTDC